MALVLPDGLGGVAVINVAEPPSKSPEQPNRAVKIAPADVATDDKGQVVIAFATLNVVDSDGDVTLPGAFPATEVLMSAWNHGSWERGSAFLPIGRGRISEERNRAIFRGRMFLNTQAGRETFEVLKALGPISRFSYGYNIVDGDRGLFEGQYVRFLRKLLVHEVSPVLRPAGVGTGVVELSTVEGRVIGYSPTDGLPVYLNASTGRK